MKWGCHAVFALLSIASPAFAQGDGGAGQASALTIGETFMIESKALGESRRSIATSEEKDLLILTKRLATILGKTTPSGLPWHHKHMPNESHATIYHPAALKALRRLFKPRPDSSATP